MDVVAATGAASVQSGVGLRAEPAYAAHDSRVQLPSYTEMARKRAGEMPRVATAPRWCSARSYPNECRLYGLACTPRQPVGRALVSDEGACRIWWANGVRENVLGRAQGVRRRGVITAVLEQPQDSTRVERHGPAHRPAYRHDRPRAGVGYARSSIALRYEHELAGYVRNLRATWR